MSNEWKLPSPRLEGGRSLEAVLAARRSVRAFTAQELTLEEISQLLWAAQGITGPQEHLRAAPSAGGCCPLELYVCWKEGVWRYRPQGHSLVLHRSGDVRAQLAEAAWNQHFLAQAPVVFAISAVFARTTRRYGERGRVRYVPMDVGHAAQNLLLEAVALGLASVPIGAFDDAAVARVLALPPEETPLYLLPVGHPSR
ncbi:MAG: SagB/ThcOx family dehydrogenase [Anaerolineae bacterium]|nr:SagB/ThcOx family dehydrogenase [Anaerolineae bacterium]MDW8068232.1 SagB/ThcOx family dehydrogenase [Anaerolineae bacterium]